MPQPFIIWTLQRTGGTTLAQLLMTLAGLPAPGHEPFNLDRRYGGLHREFLETGDEAQLRAAIREALTRPGAMKHCYELVPGRLNEILLEEALAAGWQSLILDRQNDSARMLSLIAARLTGAWGPKGAGQVIRACESGRIRLPEADIALACHDLGQIRLRRQAMAEAFRSRGLRPEVVLFEALYEDPDGARRVEETAARLGIRRAAVPGFDRLIGEALRRGGQDSPRILSYLPNLVPLTRALEAAAEAAGPFCWPRALTPPEG